MRMATQTKHTIRNMTLISSIEQAIRAGRVVAWGPYSAGPVRFATGETGYALFGGTVGHSFTAPHAYGAALSFLVCVGHKNAERSLLALEED